MKRLFVFLFVFVISCSHEKEIFETQGNESARPIVPVVTDTIPSWVDPALQNNGDLRIAVSEDSIAGFAITQPRYDSNGVFIKNDTIGWTEWGIKYETPKFGLRVLSERDIQRWGLKNYTAGQTAMTVKILCPVGNYSYNGVFAVQRDMGIPNAFLQDYDYPGMALQLIYTISAEGYIDLFSVTDKTNWFFSGGRRFIDSHIGTGPEFDGSFIMYIDNRYFDTYYAWATVPYANNLPRAGTYLFLSQVNYKNFAHESNKDNNHAAAFFTVGADGLGAWTEKPANARPRPITPITTVGQLQGAVKSMTLIWAGTNNNYKIYKDGEYIGKSSDNVFVHYFTGGYRPGTYRIVSEIKGVGEAVTDWYVTK